jgi:RimJ/RimL family protein N-acetyltransferase
MQIIESGRISLRPFDIKDANAVFSYRSLEEVAEYQYWHPYTEEQSVRFIEQCSLSNLKTRNQWIGLAVIHKLNQELIGDCALKISEITAEIGCNIHPKYQKQGFAKEILSLLLDFCFTQNNVQEIYGITDSANIASIQLMKSIHMTRSTQFEEKSICKGVLSIEHKYSINKSDWIKLKQS